MRKRKSCEKICTTTATTTTTHKMLIFFCRINVVQAQTILAFLPLSLALHSASTTFGLKLLCFCCCCAWLCVALYTIVLRVFIAFHSVRVCHIDDDDVDKSELISRVFIPEMVVNFCFSITFR